MEIRRLDLDIAIFRNRIQVSERATGKFVDQRAEFPFSEGTDLIAQPRYLEDTIVRAIRQVLSGGFSLGGAIAHVVASELPLSPSQKVLVEAALHGAGMHEVVFDL
ncbi:hypothetical protein P8Q88_09235 [Qipengyuania sp. XHP0207]|uniref:hypothetical protein n=1 Tax=Qipengyuania sp. XHP0207 TaxID=3038078 RepID=UPI00241E1B0D|nr:hypothetical protein [Qipengyuania sp. XHP0207]MDG5748366.1 hypothetical protein [Qipengyuania sp. XHP0207]